jgi:hypothetical protein
METPLLKTATVVPAWAAGIAGAANRSMTWRMASSTSRTGSGLSPRSQRRSTWLWAETTEADMSSARSEAARSSWEPCEGSPIQSEMNSRNSRW